jgi:molybdopterin molybdotransferase
MQPENALNIILNTVNPVDYELVHYNKAIGHVLLEKLVSKLDLPPYSNSAMDGFAFRYDNLKTQNKLFNKGTIKAGDKINDLFLNDGECFRIMTGAALPQDADTVVEFEKTNVIDNMVEIKEPINKGSNIRPKGEDIRKGDSLEDLSFQVLTSARIVRLVSTGNFVFKVNRKLRVAIISTGNELKYPCENIGDNTIVESNGEYVKCTLEKIGIDVVYKGISSDDIDSVRNILNTSNNYDTIVTIGGISKGDFDIINLYGAKIGIKWLFNKVDQKPGKPFSFGIFNDTPVFSFPGNPLSSAFCLFYYLLPALRKMMGFKDPYNKCIKAYLNESYFKKNNRTIFLSVNIYFEDGKVFVMPYKKQNSNIINVLMNTNGYAKIPADLCGEIKKGTLLDVYTTGLENL